MQERKRILNYLYNFCLYFSRLKLNTALPQHAPLLIKSKIVRHNRFFFPSVKGWFFVIFRSPEMHKKTSARYQVGGKPALALRQCPAPLGHGNISSPVLKRS